MAQQHERVYQPLVRAPDILRSCTVDCYTIETSTWWTSKPPPEQIGVKTRKRCREDLQEGPTPSKRLRTSQGRPPIHVESVGKAEDSSEARVHPGVPGPPAGSGSGLSSPGERGDHSSAPICSSSKTRLMTYSTGQTDEWLDDDWMDGRMDRHIDSMVVCVVQLTLKLCTRSRSGWDKEAWEVSLLATGERTVSL